MVKELYAEVMINAFLTGGTTNFWVVNDALESTENCSFVLKWFRYDQKLAEPQDTKTIKHDLKAQSSAEVYKTTDQAHPASCSLTTCFLRADLFAPNGTLLTRSHAFPSSLKYNNHIKQTELTLGELACELNETGSPYHQDCFTVTNGQYPAFFVTLEAAHEDIEGYFTENAFHLLPGESKDVRFVFKGPRTERKSWVRFKSYNDMLNYV